MKRVLTVAILLAIANASCQQQVPATNDPARNDTTEAIKFAIRQAFFQQSLPGLEHLSFKFYFKDSILMATDSLSLRLLPDHLDTLHFKKLSKQKICGLITSDTTTSRKPNFLNIWGFTQKDSAYEVGVNSLSCLPYDGGGVCYIELVKRKDSFVLVHQGNSNLN